jgi:hypothetical protein
MSKRAKYLALALLLSAVAGSIAFAAAALGRSAAWPFVSVTPAELASQGVKLTAASPPADLPISAAEATAAASKFQGGRPALETHYVHCVDTTKVPRLDEDCWAISINPKGMTAPGGAALASSSASETITASPAIRYDVVFVEPHGGKVIEATLGG